MREQRRNRAGEKARNGFKKKAQYRHDDDESAENERENHREKNKEKRGEKIDLDLYRQTMADIKRSGLDKSDYKLLKLQPIDADATDDFVGEARASYKIPYFDLSGKRIAYSRVRFLETRKRKGWGKGSRDGTFRYSQPANSAPHAYFPPYFDWKKIVKDPDQRIIITEGEKKAACACKLGLACIALGGVYAFMSAKRHMALIPDLENIDWKGRDVEIVYDADVMAKSQVYEAAERLAATLLSKGTKSISFVYFDAEGSAGSKTSLDDFLIEFGVDEFEKLERKTHDGADKIDSLNQKVCYVLQEHSYFDILNRVFFRSYHNVKERFANEGQVRVAANKTTAAIELWNSSPSRREVQAVQYMPGRDEMHEGTFNTWRPPDIQPKKGRPDKWLDLVSFIMRNGENTDWFLKWLAYPVQNPGAKLFSACFIFGEQTGVGKTFVVDPVMEYVYGKNNFYRLSSDDMTDKHATYPSKSCFVVANEVWIPEFRDRISVMSLLKDMITRERMTINEKFQPKMKYDDHCNYFFSSNHADALMLEKKDRRFFCVEAPKKKLMASDYKELDTWLREKDGASQILHYLQTLDISDFNPKGEAFKTKYRDQVIALSRDPVGDFVDKLVRDPQHLFMVNGNLPDLQLYRADDLVRVFETANPRYRFSPTASRMARLLGSAEIERRSVRISKDTPLLTLYPIFDAEKWGTKTNKQWAEHYMDKSRLYGGKSKH